MIIKFLEGHKRVATSLDKLNAGKDYLLINRQAEAIEKNKINKLRRDAIIAFGKLSLEEMRKCLRLFGVSADTMSNELVESTLFSWLISSHRTSLLSGLIIRQRKQSS